MADFEATASFGKFGVDVQRYTKTLEKDMQIQIRQAARAWLRAVIPKIPVYTGTALGTMKPLGAFLKVQIPISSVAKLKNRGPDVGATMSTFSFDKTDNTYSFEIDVNLFYYTLNDFYNMKAKIPHLINNTPWESFKAGEAAFQDYVKNVMSGRLPKLEDFIYLGDYGARH